MSDQNLWESSQPGAEDFDASDIIANSQIMSAAAFEIGASLLLTIKTGQPRSFNGEPYVLLQFEEVPETARLTDRNLRRLARLYGTAAAGWRAQPIRLTVTEITTGELAGKHTFLLDSPDLQLGESLAYQPSQEMTDLLASQNGKASAPEAAPSKRK